MSNNLAVRITGDIADIKAKIGSVESSLRQFGVEGKRSGTAVAEGMTKAKGGIRSISEQLDSMRTNAIAAFSVFALANRAQRIGQLADQIQGVNSRLLIAVGSQNAFNAAQERAYAVSAKTGTGYESTATLLSRLSQVGAGYGLTQERIATTTEVTARALQLSGAATAESTAVVRQFSQALGSGVLRGEEFNSIMENGPRLAKALADGLGLPIGKLRALAEQGLLTTDVVVAALESQAGVLEAQAENYKRTMGQAASHASDEFGRMVDAANQWTGAGQSVAATFDYVAEHMREMLGGVAVAAVGGLTVAMVRGGQAAVTWAAQTVAAQAAATASTIRLHQAVVAEAGAEVIAAERRLAALPAMFRSVAAEQALTAARANLTTATTALNTAQAQGSVVARGWTGVLRLMGGSIGIITTLLTAGATAWMIWGNKAEDAGDKAASATDRAVDALKRMRNAQAFGEDVLAPFREDVAAAEAARNAVVASKGDAWKVSRLWETDDMEIRDAENAVSQAYSRLQEAARLGRQKLEAGARTTGSALGAEILGKSFNQWLDKFRDRIDPIGGALKDLAAQAKEAGIAVDSAEYKAAEALIRESFKKKGSAAGESLDLDDYGKSALSSMQAQSQRELDILKARLAGEMSIAQRGFEANTIGLEAYYAERRRIITAESQAEIAAQEGIAAQAAAEKARLEALNPGGKRGAEQISDQIRQLDEKIAEAEGRAQVLRIQADTAVADLAADQAKAARERVDKAMSDAQAIIAATEQSLQSRVITGLETEASARAKLKSTIGEQARALESDLIPQIERLMLAASNPLARAELQAILDKIQEMNATARTQTWADGLKQGVQDYATTASDGFETAKDAATKSMQGIEDAAVNMLMGVKTSTTDVVNSIIADFARLAMQQSITQPLAGGLSSALDWLFNGGSAGASALTNVTSGLGIASAKGNVFNGGLDRYVNTVRNTPTYFDASGYRPFALGGVFAEAGPEAIMPLSRDSSGRLGVRASGAPNISVNIHESPGKGGQVEQSQGQDGSFTLDIFFDQIDTRLAANIAQGRGATARVLSQRSRLS
jgi:lambda family phage tail tape measure protein